MYKDNGDFEWSFLYSSTEPIGKTVFSGVNILLVCVWKGAINEQNSEVQDFGLVLLLLLLLVGSSSLSAIFP